MQEKLKLFIDESEDSRVYKRILDDFSRKENQTLEAFRSQFDFIDDESIKIKERSTQEKNLQIIHHTKDSESFFKFNREMIEKHASLEENTDCLETIDLENLNKPNGFWHRNDKIKIETKFDNFLIDSAEDEIEKNTVIKDDFLELFGETINKYEPSETVNLAKKNLFNQVKEKSNESSLDNTYESIKIEKIDCIESYETIDSSHLPGEILDAENQDIITTQKPYHLTKLDILQQKQATLIDSNEVKSVEINIEGQEENLVENFELDKSHDYNVYIYKSRFDF